MVKDRKKKDLHFPNIGFQYPFRKHFKDPEKIFGPFLSKSQVAADLGCGPGLFSIPMAQYVGPEGKVYAVDSNEKAIKALEKKMRKMGINNLEPHASSAHDLSFIEDASVDFIFAYGLLCSMAPENHDAAVKEFKRILKPNGKAHLSAARGKIGYMTDEKWEDILSGFNVIERSDNETSKGEYRAVVSLKTDTI
jgi:ubiquinone/menaquinone biosynthesis C-methylase UbiE